MIDLSTYTVEQLRELANKTQDMIREKQESEVADVVRKLFELSKSSGIPVEDLLAPYKKKNYPPSKVKYRNPDNPEQVWTGRGQKPAWFRANIDKGMALEKMQVG